MTIALYLILVALNVVDVWLTLRILAAGGMELNPLVRKVMDRFGQRNGLLIVKIPALIVAAFLPWWALLALCVWYSIVVCSNAEVYYK